MSDILRCPFCGGILEQSSIYNLNSYACTDLTCKGYFMTATKDMWQELIRTRKALETAKDTLHWYDDNYDSVVARNTLDEITALEQKDVK